MTDDLDREPVPGVASASRCRHPIRLLTPIRRRKYPGSTKLTVPASVEFGRYRILPHRREVLADGRPVELGGRAFDVLIALIEARLSQKSGELPILLNS